MFCTGSHVFCLFRYDTAVDPALIKIFAQNKPDCIKLMDVDNELLDDMLLQNVAGARSDGMQLLREGLVGMPEVRPVAVPAVRPAPVAVPAVLPQPVAPAGVAMMPAMMPAGVGGPVYNFSAGANITINMINAPAPPL